MADRDSKLHDKTTFREYSDDLIWQLNRSIEHYAKEFFSHEKDFHNGSVEPAVAAVMYLRQHLLAKYNDPQSGLSNEDRRQAAIVKWLGVEARNTRTNLRIPTTNPLFLMGSRSGRKCSPSKPVGASAWDLLFRAKGIVHRILGTCPSGADLTAFLLEGGGFTSGASTSKKRSLDNLARKYTERLDATPSMLRLLHPSDLSDRFPGWAKMLDGGFKPFRLVKGNVMFTVPKNAEIDRVACKEPDLNLYCQKAVGGHIRQRLRVAGIDLNDQTRNQTLARHAFSRGYATIDLSSASDSLTIELVKQLVSPDWFSLLMALRSTKTFINGASHENAMISSMGNGFTFELESLIFYALARSVQLTYDDCVAPMLTGAPVVGVYGDDLIINQVYAKTLVTFLGWCGFKVNVNKTFIEGALFESCGKHYYCGLDVSPFHIHKPMSDMSDLILVLNQLRNWMIRTGIDLFEVVNKPQHSFYEIWSDFRAKVPRNLHGGHDLEVRTSLVTLGASRCKLVPEMRLVKRVVAAYQDGMLAARLHGVDAIQAPDFYSQNDDWSSYLDPDDLRDTSEFPSRWTGKWKVRRYRNIDMFFGVATVPLYQELNL